MLRADLLLIIRRYYLYIQQLVYVGVYVDWLLAGYNPANSQSTYTHDIYQLLYIQSSAS